MNPIIIESFFDKEEFMKSRLLVWRLYTQKNRSRDITILFVSIVSFGLAILNIKYGPKESSHLLILTLTSLFLIISTFNHITKFLQKKQYLRYLNQMCDKFESNVFYITFEIGEKSVKYSDNEKSIELKWEYFLGFSDYKNYLLLVPKIGSYLDSTILIKNWSNFNDINYIIKKNLEEIIT
jgi:hypothetical protein